MGCGYLKEDNLKSCTIIISHYESVPFLRACIRQIKRYAHPDISQHIVIAEQSGDDTRMNIVKEFTDVDIVSVRPLYSGYGIDYLMHYCDIRTDYICQVHVDAYPIHKNWLHLPITLIEENNLSFVGQLQTISKVTDTIYPPTPLFAMAQCYNVAKTETYKELSIKAGFTRFHNRKQANMTWENDDWDRWAASDYNARGSDDDIVAFSWQDRHRQDDKLGLAITGFIQPSFGRIIEDLVFHFGSCRESLGVFDSMPQLYQELTKRINEDYSDELIEEMIAMARANRPPEMEILSRNFWDGKLKQSFPPTEKLNNRIEQLKNGME